MQRDGRIRTGRVLQVTLLEGDDPARTQSTGDVAQQLGWIRHVHEHPAAYHGIERVAGIDLVDVAVTELDVHPTRDLDPATRALEDVGVHVDSDHKALRANELCKGQGDVTGSAAEVEHLHALGDSSPSQELAREIPEQLMLEHETCCLRFAATQRVAVRCRRRSPVHAPEI